MSMFDHQNRKKRSHILDKLWSGGLKFKEFDQNKATVLVLYSSSKRHLLDKFKAMSGSKKAICYMGMMLTDMKI